MPSDPSSNAGLDPFTRFWSDFMSRMGGTGMPSMQPMPLPAEAMRGMQRAFLDAMTKYFEDYLRSPQFLESMKQSMDQSLAFQEQVNRFLNQARGAMQAPTRVDMDDVIQTLRGIEGRLAAKIGDLTSRMEALEEELSYSARGEAAAGASKGAERSVRKTASRPGGGPDTAKKKPAEDH